jgi:rhodanese-related sulfurtransferase
MNRDKILVLIIISVGVIALGAYIFLSHFQNYEIINYGDVTIEQAIILIERSPSLVILDVRTDLEFDSGHLKGAINIPVDVLEERVYELDLEEEILVYCRTGNRSSSAVQILIDHDFSKVYHMFEGIIAWNEAGYPLSTD